MMKYLVIAHHAENITSKFITEAAPWQGGFYERLVGLVKRALRKAIGRKLLDWDELAALLTEIEAIINTRPLTYVFEGFESGFPLTPAHFLPHHASLRVPEPTIKDMNDEEHSLIGTLPMCWKENGDKTRNDLIPFGISGIKSICSV